MNLSAMRLKVKAQLGGTASSMSDTEIDVLLNRAYRFGVPTLIPGEMFEGTWEFQAVIAVDTFAYDPHVLYLETSGARVTIEPYTLHSDKSTVPLRIWTDPVEFYARFERDGDLTSGRPSDVLVYGRSIVIRPGSYGANYYFYFPAKLGPSSDLVTAGLDDENHAMAVVLLAALETAQEKSLDEYEARIKSRLEQYLNPLKEQSLGRGHKRRSRRSF